MAQDSICAGVAPADGASDVVIVGETAGLPRSASADTRAVDEAAAMAVVSGLSRAAATQEAAYRDAQAAGRTPVSGSMAACLGVTYGIFPVSRDSALAPSKRHYQIQDCHHMYRKIGDLGHEEVTHDKQLEHDGVAALVQFRDMLGAEPGSAEANRIGGGMGVSDLIPSYMKLKYCRVPRQKAGSGRGDDVERLLDGLTERSSSNVLIFTSAQGALDAFERFAYALLAVFLKVREMDIRAFVPRGLVTDHVIRVGLFVAPDGKGSVSPLFLSYHALFGKDRIVTLLRDAVSHRLFDGDHGVSELEELLNSLMERVFDGLAQHKTLTVIFLALADVVRPRLEGRAGAMGVTLTPVETAALGGGGRSGVVSKRSRDQVGAGGQQSQQQVQGGHQSGPGPSARWDGSFDRATRKYKIPSGFARVPGGEPKAARCKSHTQASQAGAICCFSHAHLTGKKVSIKG